MMMMMEYFDEKVFFFFKLFTVFFELKSKVNIKESFTREPTYN